MDVTEPSGAERRAQPSAATSRQSVLERRRMPADQSPRHPDFVVVVLEPMAKRHEAGEADHDLAVELYNQLHTWAVAFAGSLYSGLPAHADRNEVLSQVLGLTWDACRRIDWERYAAWPAFLEAKVRRARIEAARSDDWLSRRERVRRRRFQGELARREQLAQRSLTEEERVAVADAVAPSTTRVDWAKSLLDARHPSTMADVPDAVEDMSLEDSIEQSELDEIRARVLAQWMSVIATENAGLARELQHWAQLSDSADRDLPARLAHRLAPYRPLLLAMLGEAA